MEKMPIFDISILEFKNYIVSKEQQVIGKKMAKWTSKVLGEHYVHFSFLLFGKWLLGEKDRKNVYVYRKEVKEAWGILHVKNVS